MGGQKKKKTIQLNEIKMVAYGSVSFVFMVLIG